MMTHINAVAMQQICMLMTALPVLSIKNDGHCHWEFPRPSIQIIIIEGLACETTYSPLTLFTQNFIPVHLFYAKQKQSTIYATSTERANF